MKKTILLYMMVFLVTLGLQAEDDGKNILESAAMEPGKTVKLTEVLRITDEDGDFFFKNPRRVRVAPDQSLFVLDDDHHLFKFDSGGKFIKNMVKQGEGPGEAKYIGDFSVDGNGVTVSTIYPVKVILLSLDGALNREFRVQTPHNMPVFYGRNKDEYYYYNREINIAKAKSGVSTVKLPFFHADSEGNVTDWGFSASIRSAMISERTKNNMRVRIDFLERMLITGDEPAVSYLSHTERYLLKTLDLKGRKITTTFRRAYKPVPFTERPVPAGEEGSTPNQAQPSDQYSREFYNDVYQLAMHKGKIWAFTSTLDKNKGTVVDMFDKTGKLVDCFHMALPGIGRPDDLVRKPITIEGDFLYTVEKDDEDTPSVVKYKISY